MSGGKNLACLAGKLYGEGGRELRLIVLIFSMFQCKRTRFFWHETKVRTGNNDIPLVITVWVSFRGIVEPVSMRFRNQGKI